MYFSYNADKPKNNEWMYIFTRIATTIKPCTEVLFLHDALKKNVHNSTNINAHFMKQEVTFFFDFLFIQ